MDSIKRALDSNKRALHYIRTKPYSTHKQVEIDKEDASYICIYMTHKRALYFIKRALHYTKAKPYSTHKQVEIDKEDPGYICIYMTHKRALD